MNPKFAAWGQAAEQRSPEFWDIYLGGPEMTGSAWGPGINTRASQWAPPFFDWSPPGARRRSVAGHGVVLGLLFQAFRER